MKLLIAFSAFLLFTAATASASDDLSYADVFGQEHDGEVPEAAAPDRDYDWIKGWRPAPLDGTIGRYIPSPVDSGSTTCTWSGTESSTWGDGWSNTRYSDTMTCYDR